MEKGVYSFPDAFNFDVAASRYLRTWHLMFSCLYYPSVAVVNNFFWGHGPYSTPSIPVYSVVIGSLRQNICQISSNYFLCCFLVLYFWNFVVYVPWYCKIALVFGWIRFYFWGYVPFLNCVCYNYMYLTVTYKTVWVCLLLPPPTVIYIMVLRSVFLISESTFCSGTGSALCTKSLLIAFAELTASQCSNDFSKKYFHSISSVEIPSSS